MSSSLAVGVVAEQRTPKRAGIQRVRLLYLDRAADVAVTIELDTDKAAPEIRSAAKLDAMWAKGDLTSTEDDYAYLAGVDVTKHEARLKKSWDAIKSIAEDEPRCFHRAHRASMLTEVVKRTKRKRDFLIRDLTRYWQSGKQKNALGTRYNRSGAGGENRISDDGIKPGARTILEKHGRAERGLAMSEEIARVFDTFLKKHVLKPNPLPLSVAYGKMLTAKFSTKKRNKAGRLIVEPFPPEQRPSLRQFRYYAKKTYSISARKKAQDGVEAYEQTMRPVLGNSSLVMGPGTAFQIDATETDTQLVNSIMRERPIGRANHYFATDVFSSLIGGLYVSLEAPSVLSVRQTLGNTATNKTAFCDFYGIPIEEDEWPCQNFPSSIIADRGEALAKAVDEVIEEFEFKVVNLPAYRPDWKPFVEGNFAHANHILHTLPGAIRRNSNQVRKRDSRLDAELDIYSNTQILIEFTLYFNKYHILEHHPFDLFEIQHNVKPRPIDLWRWGELHRSGALRVKSEDAIRLLCFERAEATVTGYGLRFLNRNYDCSVAKDEEWFQRARTQGVWKVRICFNRRNLDYIFLLPEGRRPLIPCPVLQRDAQAVGHALEDIQDYDQFLQLRGALMREDQVVGKVNLHARTEDIVERQRKLTRDRKKSATPISKAEMKRGVKPARNEERGRQNATIHKGVSTPANHKPASSSGARPNSGTASSVSSLSDARALRQLKLLRDRRQEKAEPKE